VTEDHFVSVIIPNYNYANYVGDAIESVMAQSYKSFELIVVDNGSTDNSRLVLEGYGKKYALQLKVVFQENRGQAGSRNRGLKESKGDLIAFLDADDVWMPNKLEEQVGLFDNQEIGLVYSSYWISDEKLNRIKVKKAKYRGDVLPFFATAGGVAIVDGGESNVIIRRECIEVVGNFDEELEESTGWDLYRRIASCYKVDYVDSPLMTYRSHGNSLSVRNKKMYKQIRLHFMKMFEDPLSSRIWHLRKKGLAQMHFGTASYCYFSKQYILLLYHSAYALCLDRNILFQLINGIKKKIHPGGRPIFGGCEKTEI